MVCYVGLHPKISSRFRKKIYFQKVAYSWRFMVFLLLFRFIALIVLDFVLFKQVDVLYMILGSWAFTSFTMAEAYNITLWSFTVGSFIEFIFKMITYKLITK